MPRHNYLANGRYNRRAANYPRTVEEVLDDSMRYRPDVLRALRAFRRSKPFRGTLAEKREKFGTLHAKLCEIYGTQTRLQFNAGRPANGYYTPAADVITLEGRLSVITYLHEFAHSIFGSDERQACRWSINLFRRLFPRSYARLTPVGHTLRRADDAQRGSLGELIEAMLGSGRRAQRRRRRRSENDAMCDTMARNEAQAEALMREIESEQRPRRCRRRRRNGDECPDDTGEGC